MDVSPQLLAEVEFREQWRGYNPAEVDDFLERLAVALGQLQEQLEEAVDRANRAERRVLDGSSGEDELRRTLVLAQRTAAAAVAEARQHAAAVTAEADAHAAAATAEADAHAVAVTAAADERTSAAVRAADERAAHVVSDAEARVASELAPLLAQRDALQEDVEAVRAWRAEVRARMADELREQLAWLDGGEAELPAPPEVVAMNLPETEDEARQDEARQDDAFRPPDTDATGVYDALAELDGGAHDDHGDHGVEGGPLAMAAADDPFLAELRRAVTDDEPLGPRDRVAPEAGDDDVDGERGDEDDLSPSSVFRRRKRR